MFRRLSYQLRYLRIPTSWKVVGGALLVSGMLWLPLPNDSVSDVDSRSPMSEVDSQSMSDVDSAPMSSMSDSQEVVAPEPGRSAKKEDLSLLSYQDQIYLLGYWLRSNVSDVDSLQGEELTQVVQDQLGTEFGVTDKKVISDVVEMFEESRG